VCYDSGFDARLSIRVRKDAIRGDVQFFQAFDNLSTRWIVPYNAAKHGLPTEVARGLVGAGITIGRSTHAAATCRQALLDGADYAFLGPIWETPSHPGGAGIGVDEIGAAGAGPVVAIGGVDPSRAQACRQAGAAGIAAIRALWLADDPGSAATALLLSFAVDAP